jgi:hypothetical protein
MLVRQTKSLIVNYLLKRECFVVSESMINAVITN